VVLGGVEVGCRIEPERSRIRFVNPGTLVLFDPDPAATGWQNTALQLADRTAADPFDFVRLNLLVRLWRRSSWNLGELDQALTVFLPPATTPPTAANLGTALRTVLFSMAHLDQLIEKVGGTRKGWMDGWAAMPTAGRTPLITELARRLGTSLRELTILTALTGVDPFLPSCRWVPRPRPY
jgi:hypothetical protein